jgi:hypothetical protein
MGDQKSTIAAVYLARGANPDSVDLFRRFAISYQKFPAGREHKLYILYKGFVSASDLDRAIGLFSNIGALAINLEDDSSFDIGAYIATADMIEEGQVCFLNTYSEILAPGWLAKLALHLDRPEVGLVGATGSFETTTLPDFPPFPNAHLRSNAFMIDRELFRAVLGNTVLRKREDTLRVESGPASLMQHVLAEGLEVLVVGRNGRGYPPKWWPASDTFRQGDQGNLLIGDNHTRAYLAADRNYKRFLANVAWGPYLGRYDAPV